MRQIVYQIERFDGTKSYIQEYTFPYEPNKTVLWGLTKIKETIDSSLTFDAVCRCAVCGACAVRINGQAMLACETALDSVLGRFGDVLSIAPLQNFKAIRDLVVDWEDKTERMAKIKPWLSPRDDFSAKTGCVQTPDEFKKISSQINCILCGACASECNKLSADSNDFYEPFIYTKAQRLIADSRGAGAWAQLSPALEESLWKCVHCQECVTKCPKHVEPAEDISKLRQKSISMGATNNPGARHALAICDDMADTGRLNEAKMAIKTEGLLKSAAKLPFALRLMGKGKLKPFHSPSPIKDIQQVRSIIRAVKEEAEK